MPKLLAGKLLVQANSGGGKSWLVRRIVEQSYGKVQIIVIDPEGEYGTLREKFDFILAGKGGDTPADPRSAALLARKLLELKASAIIDIYELHPQDRKKFVRLFLDSMVNAPKELYNDVLVVLDEGHMFAPENGESESANAVIDMASRGRKRGYSLVLATQRISKLSKDVAAECNNKLIGRTSLDIDRKRAADELGITNKEQVLALRTLQPGEFFAFGPAISDEVVKIKVGDVQTSIPKVGSKLKVVPPTEGIKKVLAKLADLPAEAEEELRTVSDLRRKVGDLTRELSKKVIPTVSKEDVKKEAEKLITKAMIDMERWFGEEMKRFQKNTKSMVATLIGAREKIDVVLKNLDQFEKPTPSRPDFTSYIKTPPLRMPHIPNPATVSQLIPGVVLGVEGINSREQRILDAIAWLESIDAQCTPPAIAFVAGYVVSGNFNNLKGGLRTRGLISYPTPGTIALTSEGRVAARPPESTPTQEELHNKIRQVLGDRFFKILQPVIDAYPNDMSVQELAQASGYEISGNFNNMKGKLKTLGLIDYPSPGRVKAEPFLFI